MRSNFYSASHPWSFELLTFEYVPLERRLALKRRHRRTFKGPLLLVKPTFKGSTFTERQPLVGSHSMGVVNIIDKVKNQEKAEKGEKSRRGGGET